MKRTLCIILALSMIACSMLVMSGCGVARSVLMFVVNDAKKAEYLSLFSDIYYSGGVEIETSFTSITKTEALGGTVTSKNESVTKETIINGNDKDKFAHRTVETVRSSVQMGDREAQEETYVRSTGFSDGFMYITNDHSALNEGKTKIKSEIGYDKYIEYLQLKSLVTPQFDPIVACNNVKLEKNSEKTKWIITCSELKDDGAEILQELLVGDLSGVADSSVFIDSFGSTVTVSRKTKAIEKIQMDIALTVIVGGNRMTAELTSESVYCLPPTDADLTPVEFEEYTLTGDVSKIIRAQHFINELSDSDGMSLTVKRSEQELGASYSETSKVQYGVALGNKKYGYRIESKVKSGNEVELIITYDGSMQKIRLANANELISNEPQSEKDARKFIRSLFSGIEFDLYAQNEVTVSETEDGGTKYVIDLDVPESVVQRMTDNGTAVDKIAVKRMDLIVICDADGNIVKMYYCANVKARDSNRFVTIMVSLYDFEELHLLSVG